MSQPMIITGRKVATGMALFFGVIFTVNGVFSYLALDSWPGLVIERPYEAGLMYNQTLDQAEQQATLGWWPKFELLKSADGHSAQVTILGETAPPYDEFNVQTIFRRPVNDVDNLPVSMVETEAGIFEANVLLPARGRWYADVIVLGNGEIVYRAEHEFLVQ